MGAEVQQTEPPTGRQGKLGDNNRYGGINLSSNA